MKKLFLLAAVLSMSSFANASLASYTDLMAIARDSYFQGRVKMAFDVVALSVMNESNETPSHGVRVAFANKVLSGQINMYELTVGALTFETIVASAVNNNSPIYSVADSDLQASAYYFFNAYAGVSQ